MICFSKVNIQKCICSFFESCVFKESSRPCVHKETFLENKTVTGNKLLHAPFRARVAKTGEDWFSGTLVLTSSVPPF